MPLSDEIQAVEIDLSWLFSRAFHLFLLAIKTLAAEITSYGPQEVEIIKQSVADGVLKAEATGGSSIQKLEAAGLTIAADLLTKNIALSMSAINAMCSAVVADWNANHTWPAKL